MKNTLFIHANHKQLFGAKLSKYSFEREVGPNRNFDTHIILAEELPEMQNLVGKTFTSNKEEVKFTLDNLQSFTLTRFAPPQLMNYKGRAIVIDPDIFALEGTNIDELFEMDMEGNSIAACYREDKECWESSVMLLDCEKLKHWNLRNIIYELTEKKTDKKVFMALQREKHIKRLSWIWNNMDKINPDSKILHTTARITQPWKTGLPINYTQKPLPKLFGFIRREPIHKLLGKYPTHYRPHPNKNIVDFFFTLLKSAIKDGEISEKYIEREIRKKNVRSDMFDVLSQY